MAPSSEYLFAARPASHEDGQLRGSADGEEKEDARVEVNGDEVCGPNGKTA